MQLSGKKKKEGIRKRDVRNAEEDNSGGRRLAEKWKEITAGAVQYNTNWPHPFIKGVTRKNSCGYNRINVAV